MTLQTSRLHELEIFQSRLSKVNVRRSFYFCPFACAIETYNSRTKWRKKFKFGHKCCTQQTWLMISFYA